jgi:RND superfamily putative drug exporter
MFDRLGRLVLNLRFVLVAVWVVAAIAFGALGPSLSQVGSADETSFLPKNAESLAARNVIKAAFPNDSAPSVALIVFSRQGGLTDADRSAIESMRGWLEGTGHPEAILRYVTAEKSPSLASMFRSSDGVVELARVDLDSPSFLPRTNTAIDAIRAHLAAADVLPAGLVAQVSGQAGIGRDYLGAIKDGTDRTTLVTILLVVVVLLLIYRAPLAAMVPLATIGCAFLVSRGLLGFLAQGGWKLSSVLDSFIVVLVFGVGTDYTIFLVSRFREELGRNSYADAVRVTVSRMGAVIAASAATVIVGLSSMIVASFGMIQTTGPALALTIFITLLAGLSLAPSLMAIFGRRLFWPRHEQTRTADSEEKGFWAALARRITDRPGLLAGLVLVLLAVPLLALPQLKENFNVLEELPSGAESRVGFATLSQHLAEGQLMPLNVLVEVPGGNLAGPAALVGIGQVERRIAALPDVQSVSSVVDPKGEGKISDVLKPAIQLAAMAEGFAKPPSTDINVQLSDTSLAGINSTVSYVGGLDKAYPRVAGTALTGAKTDLAILQKVVVDGRKQALVANQLGTIAAQLQAAALASSGSSASAVDVAAQLVQLKAYLDELGAAVPALAPTDAYKAAQAAIPQVAASHDAAAFLTLVRAVSQMQAWFEALPTATYFTPASIPATAEQVVARQATADARARLPGELGQLAAAFGADDLYAAPDLVAAYESKSGDVARLYVTTVANPYDTSAFDTVRSLRTLMSGQAAGFGPGATTYVGGPTAEFTDVQSTISADFLRVAAITIVGILLVLVLLLRALTAPAYLVLTVLLSYAASLSLSAFILQHVFGQAGLNYFIPLMVFVLLVALGSDYNIFLMSRVREESATRPLRQGIRAASARTGTVITSAGLILAGTFGALITSPLQLLFQVGVTVGLGVLIDTFIVRSLLVPAVTAFIGEWAWWPFHRRGDDGHAGEQEGTER